MKTLVLTAHPDLSKSRINRVWFDALSDAQEVTTRDLTDIGGAQLRFDIETEQALLMAHDRIVFQFPFYWYSAPPVMKAWMDQVLGYGFAYGPGGDHLKGREFLILVSTGGPEPQLPRGRVQQLHDGRVSEAFPANREPCRYDLSAPLCGSWDGAGLARSNRSDRTGHVGPFNRPGLGSKS